MPRLEIRRGDIFYINKGANATGNEQLPGRPGIVVSNDLNNANSNVVEVVYCTTQPKTDLPTHVTILSTSLKSTVLCEQITTVSVERFGNYIGYCTEEEMKMIDDALAISLSLDGGEHIECNVSAYVPKKKENVSADDASINMITMERDMYKRMYETLLDRVVPMGNCDLK